jgi:hypothetical protein
MLLNDLAWITFTAPVGAMVAQCFCLALAVYLDENAKPIFPRWVGHFSVLIALAIAPAAAAAIVRTGPLAWNGAVSFWLRIGAYAAFIAVMFFVLRTAIKRQTADEDAVVATQAWPATVAP